MNPNTEAYIASLKAKQAGGDHYVRMSVQPWDVIDTWSIEQQIGFFRGNAIKYLMRMGSKDAQLQEVKKAMHYMEKLVSVLSNQQSIPTHDSVHTSSQAS